MNNNLHPRLRTADKTQPLYRLNHFPETFPYALGRELIYLLATRGESARLEGADWEEIFARCIGAQWAPSNVGLDDITHQGMARGAKTVKNKKPFAAKSVRLVSGRNSTIYSFGDDDIRTQNPEELGEKILSIWNQHVADVRKKFPTLRTVVLLKGDGLAEVSVFETETIFYQKENYIWQWNDNDNLEGLLNENNRHVFTWQPHGSQFTIIEEVPTERLKLRIRKPEALNQEQVLNTLKVDDSWIEIVR
ncbi:MAG: hypothetical protein LBS59_03490 [Puniceicoccales bacterium]|jgi:hypothetical protein|nr:hypothetical protein [Puniceicoccales bacterium]